MSFDVLDRARQALSDYRWAKACRVEPAPWPNRLIGDLAEEVGRLRKRTAVTPTGCLNPPDWWNAMMMQSAECGECEYCDPPWTSGSEG